MTVYDAHPDMVSLYQEWSPSERTTDIQFGPGMSQLLLAGWLVACAIGAAFIVFFKVPLLGIGFIAVPSLIGMILKPSFALSLWMLILPSGTAVSLVERFTLNKMIGLTVAFCFFFNIMISRPTLRVNKAALWAGLGYIGWVLLALLAVQDYDLITQLVSRLQLAVLLLIAYWILRTNTRSAFHWVLRSYVIGTLGTIALAIVTGTAIQAMDESQGRFTATAGGSINANILSALVAMAFLTSVYLFLVDRRLLWRIGYVAGLIFLTVTLFKTGSRGSVVGLGAALVVAFLGKQLMTNIRYLLAAVLVLSLFAGLGYFLLSRGKIDEAVSSRLTNVQYARDSLDQRMEYNKTALKAGLKYPFGTGYYGWFNRTNSPKYPHNELMFSMGVYGLPAALLYLLFLYTLFRLIRRIPPSSEKLFAKAIFTFLVLIGLKGYYMTQKFYWIYIAVILVCELFGHIQWQEIHNSSDFSEETGYEDIGSCQ